MMMWFALGMQGWFNIQKSINVIYQIKVKKKKAYDHHNSWISIWQNSRVVVIKKIIGDIYGKLEANITLINERMKTFSLQLRTKWGYSLSLPIFNIASAKQGKEKKIKTTTKTSIQIGNKKIFLISNTIV